MLSFDSAGLIVTEQVGNQIIFRMPEHQVKEWKEFFSGKVRKHK
jgi:hypothetical protein